MTPEDIIAQVAPAQKWADNTVRTLINRLLRKKAIAGGKENGRYLYRPLIARDAYVLSESQGLLDRLFNGQFAPFVTHFAEHRALSPKDIEALEALVAELKKNDHG